MEKAHVIPGITEAQLASIIESATDAIISTDSNQRIILFNHAAEAMFGRPASEALGQSLDILIPERYHAAHRVQVGAFGESGVTARSMQSPGQLVGVRANGEEFPIEAMISHAEAGGQRIFTVIIRDITERVRTERARQEFLAMLGHELRNPLGAISNALSLARMRAGEDPPIVRPLQVLERQVRHMTRLVNDLIDVSRITRGQIQMQIEDVDLAFILESALQTLRSRFESRSQTMEVSIPDVPIMLRADPVRLNQVFTNLLDNAAKFTDVGGTIRVEAEREGSFAVVRISDDGRGIAPEFLPRLFEPFVQANQGFNRTEGGLGIGLTLTKRIIGLHGGTIQATSEGLGKGATFTVRLPILGRLPVK